MGKICAAVSLALLAVILALNGCGSGSAAPGQAVLPAPGAGAPGLSQSLEQALSQLDAMPTPHGADTATFANLKAGLRTMLIARGTSKLTSAAPESARSKVDDLSVALQGSSAHFHWSYRNEGDYNQDSVVNVTDLAVLGIHFGKDSTAPDWAVARAADGNADGRVDIKDLTSIGVNYLRRVTRYSLQHSSAPEETGVWSPVADVPFSDSSIPAGEMRQFNLMTGSIQSGYYRVTPGDQLFAGIASAPVEWTSPDLGDWTMFGHDAQHTHQSEYVGSQTGKLKWVFRTTGPGFGFTGAVVGTDSTIYVGSGPDLHALNPDGSVKWRAENCWPTTIPALSADGTIYVATNDSHDDRGKSKLFAFNPDVYN
jgi:hypothetical protein